MKKYFASLLFAALPFCLAAQINVHQAVLFIDDKCIESGFPTAAMQANIQDHLNRLLSDKGKKVNVLILSQECPRLEYVLIDGQGYYIGPEYNGNNVWCKTGDPDSKVIQILPGDALAYNTSAYTAFSSGKTSNGIWEGLQFHMPWQPHHTKYYCLIHEVLNRLYDGDPPVPSLEDCPSDMESTLDSLIAQPNLYLDGQALQAEELKGALRQAKSEFCTNLLFYSQYLHTRDLDADDLHHQIVNNIGNDYMLVVAKPKTKEGGSNIYSQVFVEFGKGSAPATDNCYPTSRTLSESDEDALINKLVDGGAESSLSKTTEGIGYLLDYILTADQEPVPGNVSGCDYGQGNGNDDNSYLRVNFPEFKFSGPELNTPGSNGHVKWHNYLEDSDIDAVGSCTEAANSAASHGLNMQFHLASGCGTNNAPFADSRAAYEQNNPPGAGTVVWMYYDKCSDRLFYDLKITDGFVAQLNPGYQITHPDSLALLKDGIEEILKNKLAEASNLDSYQNATLDESEYPVNLNVIGGGVGSSCGDEDPWKFGLRYPGTFSKKYVPKMLGECIVLVYQMIKNQEVPERLWHPYPQDSCMFDMPGVVAGAINGCLDMVSGVTWNLIGLLNMGVEFTTADAGKRKAILNEMSNPLNLILGQYTQNLDCINTAECQEERIQCFIRLLVNAFFDIFTGKSLLNVAGNISNVGKTVDDKLKMFASNYADKYNTWKRTLNEAKHRNHDVFLGSLPEHAQLKLTKHASLSKIWEKIADGAVPGVSLAQYKQFLERMPAADFNDDFYKKFDEIFTPEGVVHPEKTKAFIDDVNNNEPSNFINVLNYEGKKYLGAWDEAFKGGLVHLRVNVEFLDTVDDFVSGSVGKHFEDYNCSLVEHAVIRHYTGDYHLDLNKALEGFVPMTPEFIEFKNTLNPALDKLPDYQGPVYRGVGSVESSNIENWAEGDVHEIPKFLSSSTEFHVAEKFRKDNNGTVFIYFKPCKTGKNIAAIAILDEYEVLYRTDKKFRIIKKEPRPGDPEITEFTFVEED